MLKKKLKSEFYLNNYFLLREIQVFVLLHYEEFPFYRRPIIMICHFLEDPCNKLTAFLFILPPSLKPPNIMLWATRARKSEERWHLRTEWLMVGDLCAGRRQGVGRGGMTASGSIDGLTQNCILHTLQIHIVANVYILETSEEGYS